MVKVAFLRDIPKEKHEMVQAMADSCMAHEEFLNTGEMCWFISERFYQQFKNNQIAYDETKHDGIRGLAILHVDKKHKELCVSHLFVKAKHRNKGIATKILKAGNGIAKALGFKLALNANPRNTNALKLYAKLGFVPTAGQGIKMVKS